ncbi:hypothetical protein, partial [Rhodopirellula bahusiensis]|uniref:hypothetical protein n=1 Tax=Rhodopirellula bahusiensis TaxID=2014065 RepID=UPI00326506C4
KGDGGNSVRPGVCQAGVLADGWRVECGFIAKEAKISGLPRAVAFLCLGPRSIYAEISQAK